MGKELKREREDKEKSNSESKIRRWLNEIPIAKTRNVVSYS